MRRLTAVVVGCGRIGSGYDEARRSGPPRTHAGAYRAAEGVELVAGVDPSAARRAAFETRWRVPTYASIEQLARHVRPALWSVCTPPSVRIEVVRSAIRHGARAIWCEKPLANTTGEAVRIERSIRASGIPLVLNHSRRWDEGHQKAIALLRTGRLGPLEHGVVHYTRGLRNYGSHAIDLLLWSFGEPAWVRAAPGYETDSTDPSAVAMLGYRTGAAVALLPVQRASFNVFEIDLLCSGGRVTFRDFGRHITVDRITAMKGWHGERTLGPRRTIVGTMTDTLGAALRDVVRAATFGAKPRCSAAEGVATVRIVDGIERALTSASVVRFPRDRRL